MKRILDYLLTIISKYFDRIYKDSVSPIYKHQYMRTPVYVLIIGLLSLMVIQTNIRNFVKPLKEMYEQVNLDVLTKSEIEDFNRQKVKYQTIIIIPEIVDRLFLFFFIVFGYHFLKGMFVDINKNNYQRLLIELSPDLELIEIQRIQREWVRIKGKDDYNSLMSKLKDKLTESTS